jgi:hypothetical protein
MRTYRLWELSGTASWYRHRVFYFYGTRQRHSAFPEPQTAACFVLVIKIQAIDETPFILGNPRAQETEVVSCERGIRWGIDYTARVRLGLGYGNQAPERFTYIIAAAVQYAPLRPGTVPGPRWWQGQTSSTQTA